MPRAATNPQMSIALAWLHTEENGIYNVPPLPGMCNVYVRIWEWVKLLIFGVFIDDDDY